MKKALAVLCAALLLFTSLPSSIWAEESDLPDLAYPKDAGNKTGYVYPDVGSLKDGDVYVVEVWRKDTNKRVSMAWHKKGIDYPVAYINIRGDAEIKLSDDDSVEIDKDSDKDTYFDFHNGKCDGTYQLIKSVQWTVKKNIPPGCLSTEFARKATAAKPAPPPPAPTEKPKPPVPPRRPAAAGVRTASLSCVNDLKPAVNNNEATAKTLCDGIDKLLPNLTGADVQDLPPFIRLLAKSNIDNVRVQFTSLSNETDDTKKEKSIGDLKTKLQYMKVEYNDCVEAWKKGKKNIANDKNVYDPRCAAILQLYEDDPDGLAKNQKPFLDWITNKADPTFISPLEQYLYFKAHDTQKTTDAIDKLKKGFSDSIEAGGPENKNGTGGTNGGASEAKCGKGITPEDCKKIIEIFGQNPTIERATFEFLVLQTTDKCSDESTACGLLKKYKEAPKDSPDVREFKKDILNFHKTIDPSWTELLKEASAIPGTSIQRDGTRWFRNLKGDRTNKLDKWLLGYSGLPEPNQDFYCKYWGREQQAAAAQANNPGNIRTGAKTVQEGVADARSDAQATEAAQRNADGREGATSDTESTVQRAPVETVRVGTDPDIKRMMYFCQPPDTAVNESDGKIKKSDLAGSVPPVKTPEPAPAAGGPSSKNLYGNAIAGAIGAFLFGAFSLAAFPLGYFAAMATMGAVVGILTAQFVKNPPGSSSPTPPPTTPKPPDMSMGPKT